MTGNFVIECVKRRLEINVKFIMAKVKVYTTPTCTYCVVLKKYFEEKGVEYEEVDVSEDEEAQKRMIEKTNQMGVPVVEIGEEEKFIVGFDKEKINQELNL